MIENGLRRAGGTQITVCCGREALPPMSDADYSYISETDDGQEITDENFPDADFVCPGCGRTWPQICDHQNVRLRCPMNPDIDDGSQWFEADCQDCEQRVEVLVGIRDARSDES